jgi:hypothetical protein
MRKTSRALKQDAQTQGIQTFRFNTQSASLEASKNIQAVHLIQASGLLRSTIVSTPLSSF